MQPVVLPPDWSKRYVKPGWVKHYLLDLDHRDGGSKAKYYLELGFDEGALERTLMQLPVSNPVSGPEPGIGGMRYICYGAAPSPDGRTAYIKSVWQVDDGTDAPFVITAPPLKPRLRRRYNLI